jgi:hypothetical protein
VLERNQAIDEEVGMLLQAGFIREVQYLEWLANMVMVKKANGKWKMCVDFINLNKACPNESFPLSRIDLLVDSTTSHKLLSFRDAFSGYNQIRMYEPDQEKTSFISSWGFIVTRSCLWAKERQSYLLEIGKYDVQASNM